MSYQISSWQLPLLWATCIVIVMTQHTLPLRWEISYPAWQSGSSQRRLYPRTVYTTLTLVFRVTPPPLLTTSITYTCIVYYGWHNWSTRWFWGRKPTKFGSQDNVSLWLFKRTLTHSWQLPLLKTINISIVYYGWRNWRTRWSRGRKPTEFGYYDNVPFWLY